jgi:hypothetical protein
LFKYFGEKPPKFQGGDFSAIFSLMFKKSASGSGSGCYWGLNMHILITAVAGLTCINISAKKYIISAKKTMLLLLYVHFLAKIVQHTEAT